jgi:oligoribonuclease (3'-5' exoribonuclease)
MKVKPYLSIDIETTGLDVARSQVLQVAAVYDDGGPIESLKKIDILVNPGPITYGEPFALQMNAGLLKRIAAGEAKHLEDAQYTLRNWLLQFGTKIPVAGKNAAGFDIPILRNNGFPTEFFSHRVIDAGSVYFTKFGYSPSFSELNKYLGRPPVTHDALSDCFDVVHAIRAAMEAK